MLLRRSIAWLLAILGVLLVAIAFVNLYNIDRQPRWLLAVVAGSGCIAILVGLALGKPSATPRSNEEL